mmetsp:Transcript_36091/g.115896  ORF Transcript_36091/g.115896 Transcript_36091/m.115896 type:complete len:202 (+) Transcript_36091:1913-2518(+)|eukprot:scaffold1220_cov117-Isochrysis_galbana.AAC.11
MPGRGAAPHCNGQRLAIRAALAVGHPPGLRQQREGAQGVNAATYVQPAPSLHAQRVCKLKVVGRHQLVRELRVDRHVDEDVLSSALPGRLAGDADRPTACAREATPRAHKARGDHHPVGRVHDRLAAEATAVVLAETVPLEAVLLALVAQRRAVRPAVWHGAGPHQASHQRCGGGARAQPKIDAGTIRAPQQRGIVGFRKV